MIDSHSREVMRKKFHCKISRVHDVFFPIEEQYFSDKKTIQPDTIALLLTGMKSAFALKMLDMLSKS